jgi:predicted deacylase
LATLVEKVGDNLLQGEGFGGAVVSGEVLKRISLQLVQRGDLLKVLPR